jgi:hypothetical protein
MAEKHPYLQTPGQFAQLVTYLRRSFPSTVTADTVKKLGLAPKNESYMINTLRFMELIDDESNKTEAASKVFSLHQDQAFQKGFGDLVKKAYSELFGLHGDAAWDLDTDSLISFFRQTDKSSAVVGKLQASTFKTLVALAGHGEVPERKTKTKQEGKKTSASKQGLIAESIKAKEAMLKQKGGGVDNTKRDFGLTVRIEINLPAEGNQETYDRIFKSIRENLLNG